MGSSFATTTVSSGNAREALAPEWTGCLRINPYSPAPQRKFR